jgi:hypothetical protein
MRNLLPTDVPTFTLVPLAGASWRPGWKKNFVEVVHFTTP